MIKLIVATDKNKLIGNKNTLPWKIKDELIFFKKNTINSTLLMGRKTFEGLPKKLPDRKMVVLSSGDVHGADIILKNEEELLKLFKKFKNSKEVLWIAGGKSIYEKYYVYSDEIIISEIKNTYKGDVFLNIDLKNWNKKEIYNHDKFTAYKYTKK